MERKEKGREGGENNSGKKEKRGGREREYKGKRKRKNKE